VKIEVVLPTTWSSGHRGDPQGRADRPHRRRQDLRLQHRGSIRIRTGETGDDAI
jgi:hypothetical protein